MINKQKIFICCTEQSGENICFNILKRINKKKYIIDGVSGKESEKFLKNKFFDISDFKSIGFFEILLSLNKYIKMIHKLSDIIINQKYDLVICIDSPDFNYNLAKNIRKKGFKKKIIQIVAPTVWAWRKKRAKKFAKYYDEIFTLFKFENKYFNSKGLKSTFIGHPIYYLKKTVSNNKKYLISFLPGSRDKEVEQLFPYFECIYEYLYKNKNLNFQIFIPTLPHLIDKINKKTKNWKIKTIITTDTTMIENYYKSVFLSITCSGTATLEIAKRLIPQIVIYKLNTLTVLLFSLFVKVKYANLLNIVSDKMIIDELVNFKLNKKDLLIKFINLLHTKELRDYQILQIDKNLSYFENSIDPYKKCEERIDEIISKAI